MAAGQLKKGHALAALILGAIELISALIIIICSFVLAGKANISSTLTPYWAGIPFIIPGILGVVSGVTKNKCAMIAFMVLNIICFILQLIGTILLAIVVTIWAAYASNVSTNCRTESTNVCKCYSDGWGKGTSVRFTGISSCGDVSTMSSILYTITIFLVIGSLVALASTILGCAALCCNGTEPTTTVIVHQPGVVMQQQQQAPVYK